MTRSESIKEVVTGLMNGTQMDVKVGKAHSPVFSFCFKHIFGREYLVFGSYGEEDTLRVYYIDPRRYPKESVRYHNILTVKVMSCFEQIDKHEPQILNVQKVDK